MDDKWVERLHDAPWISQLMINKIYNHWNDLKDISLKDLSQIVHSELTMWDLKAQKAIEELENGIYWDYITTY